MTIVLYRFYPLTIRVPKGSLLSARSTLYLTRPSTIVTIPAPASTACVAVSSLGIMPPVYTMYMRDVRYNICTPYQGTYYTHTQ